MTAALTPTVAFNEAATRQWLETLHGRSSGHLWVGSTSDFRGRTFDLRGHDWADRATRYIARLDHADAAGIYVRTTSLGQRPREGRGHDDDSHTLPGLAADLDLAGPGHKTSKPLPPDPAAAKRLINETGLLDPSIWVHSGGGLYAWWLLEQPHTIGDDLPRIKRLTARWQDVIAATSQRLGWTYGSVGDLARILRIPGTVNRKPAMPEPAPCRIVHDSGRRYSLANLRENLHDAIAALPAPEPVVRRPLQSAIRSDGLKPWHDYEARTDWADILVTRGWTFSHERGHVRHWVRPGKNRREGFSATTGRDPARDRLWVFSDATEFESNRPYNKFEAYALLEHGGDVVAAGRELRRLGYGASRPGRVAA